MTHPLLVVEDQRPAIVDADTGWSCTYAQLAASVRRRADAVARYRGGVVLLGATNSVSTIVDYLALTAVGATVALLDPASDPEIVQHWIGAYCPEGVWGFMNAEPVVGAASNDDGSCEESVLLATSGSTGSPKFVRLSAANVLANAGQIAEALRIDTQRRALAHLPFFYTYGLSVLNSHLIAGASIVLTSTNPMRTEFWNALHEHRVTTLSGVPYSYEMYRRVGMLDMDLPDLRHMTQAGGRMEPERVIEFHNALAARGASLHVMYGQTEATARIAVLDPADLPEAAGSVGRAVPRGTVTIADGEVVFRGPNVMLGYANSRADLGQGDKLGGVLYTGDLGELDEHGRLWITGRARRIAKVFGSRVSLDDVEAKLRSFGTLAAVDAGDRVAVFIERADGPTLTRQMEHALGFPPRALVVYAVEQVPTTPAGKVDYRMLEKSCTS
jgi:acyl-CoA synthetase (AMP-forming)/AMP-acid ligase II